MKVAVPIWLGRVAPVFDVAGQLVLVELADGEEIDRRQETLGDLKPEQRAGKLSDLGVDTLICGALSEPLETLLKDSGVQVLGRVCGNLDEVLKAYCAGSLKEDRFAMPGCRGRDGQPVPNGGVRGGGLSAT